jgi:hypothetical protein
MPRLHDTDEEPGPLSEVTNPIVISPVRRGRDEAAMRKPNLTSCALHLFDRRHDLRNVSMMRPDQHDRCRSCQRNPAQA